MTKRGLKNLIYEAVKCVSFFVLPLYHPNNHVEKKNYFFRQNIGAAFSPLALPSYSYG